MFTRCIFCHSDLPANQTVEQFPVGTRIAFDPGRGRLWVVCKHCSRWNLAPIDERWEVLEALERLSVDRGRLLSQTEHIALIRVEDIEIVRVGRAKLAEEAWWRYGAEMQKRRSRYKVVQAVQVATIVGLMSTGIGGAYLFLGGGDPFNDYLRWRKFGKTLWRGEMKCPVCGAVLKEVSFKRSKHMILTSDDNGQPVLHLRCRNCGFSNAEGGTRFSGPQADAMLRRTLAYHNFSGAKEQHVKDAVGTIDQAGSPERLIRELARRHFRISHEKRKSAGLSIALEIAVNDETERQLLELELKELEARWREEEELAAIVDGELTEVPLLERIRTKLPG
jgi:hypothetical protein